MTKTVSFWIVGKSNPDQAPAVAFDLHDHDGTIIKSDSHALPANCDPMREARTYATGFAQRHGAAQVHYDVDSTDCFKRC